jgi:hypothetical protein
MIRLITPLNIIIRAPITLKTVRWTMRIVIPGQSSYSGRIGTLSRVGSTPPYRPTFNALGREAGIGTNGNGLLSLRGMACSMSHCHGIACVARGLTLGEATGLATH